MTSQTRNGVKNGEDTQFSSQNQPSNEAKKAGWARKKQSLAFMDKVTEYLNMTCLQLQELETNIENNKGCYSVNDLLALKYVLGTINSNKYLFHFIDLHVPKTKSIDSQEESKEKNTRKKTIIQIVDGRQNVLNL